MMTAETGPDPLTLDERVARLREHLEREKSRRRRAEAAQQVGDELIRKILEAVCRRDGISLESSIPGAKPGESARNYELADRLGIGYIFGLKADVAEAVKLTESGEVYDEHRAD
jgi:hypothetical protein